MLYYVVHPSSLGIECRKVLMQKSSLGIERRKVFQKSYKKALGPLDSLHYIYTITPWTVCILCAQVKSQYRIISV